MTHIFFFPHLARGHIIPAVETARLLSQRPGVRCTIVTTAGNSTFVRDSIAGNPNLGLLLVPFPSAEVGLPAGIECASSLPDGSQDTINRFLRGVELLRRPFELLTAAHRPDAIVANSVVFWSADVAAALAIPHFVLSTFSPFAVAIAENIYLNKLDTTTGPVSISGLPHPISLTPAEMPPYSKSPFLLDKMRHSQNLSRAILFTSFYELAPEYIDHLVDTNLTGRKMDVFCIGPVRAASGDADRNWDGIKSWLDEKPEESVLYVSFGSECVLSQEQLREIAVGLAACAHPFLWVVRGGRGGGDTIEKWLPENFHEEVKGRGMIVTEWAPQVAVLNHRATGGMILHCGWNSTLEALCAGLAVIAWPLHSEQFVNELLVVDVLGTGLRVLEGEDARTLDLDKRGLVKAETIRAAVDRLLSGGDDESVGKMKATAKKYKELAAAATQEGGSSYVNIGKLIDKFRA